MPARIGAIPSMMKIQRQPARSNQCKSSSEPEKGVPKAFDNGMADIKQAIALARCSGRNHNDRYTITEGKKPPSKKPSQKRKKYSWYPTFSARPFQYWAIVCSP